MTATRFASLSTLCVRAICGPCTVDTDDACLISLKTSRELWTAVRASDGRVYDAISLHTWLRLNNHEVIPTQPIRSVSINLWPTWCLSRSTCCAKVLASRIPHLKNAAVSGFLSCRRYVNDRIQKHERVPKRRRHMMLSILDTYEQKHRLRNARRIVRSDGSAFSQCRRRIDTAQFLGWPA